MRHTKTSAAPDKSMAADALREVTPEGEDLARKTAAVLFELGFRPKGWITSAAPRAVKTSQIMLDEMGVSQIPIIIVPGLYGWEEMHVAEKEVEFTPNLQIYHDALDGKFRPDVLQFEENRMAYAQQAFAALAALGVSREDHVGSLTHAWMANIVLMARDPGRRDAHRNIGFKDAHGLVINGDNVPLLIGPTGIVVH